MQVLEKIEAKIHARLNPIISADIEMLSPHSFSEAISLALNIERKTVKKILNKKINFLTKDKGLLCVLPRNGTTILSGLL